MAEDNEVLAVDVTIGGVGVGAGVPIGEQVPTELSDIKPGELTVMPSQAGPPSTTSALGSPPILTDI